MKKSELRKLIREELKSINERKILSPTDTLWSLIKKHRDFKIETINAYSGAGAQAKAYYTGNGKEGLVEIRLEVL